MYFVFTKDFFMSQMTFKCCGGKAKWLRITTLLYRPVRGLHTIQNEHLPQDHSAVLMRINNHYGKSVQYVDIKGLPKKHLTYFS